MKKFLIATTALVSVLAGAAFADDANSVGPNVKVGGLVDFQSGFRSQKKEFKTEYLTRGQKNVKFNTSSKVNVSADGVADAGFKYGGNATLVTTAKTRTGKDDASGKLDRTYVYLETGFGRAELGSNFSASKTMRVNAGSFARATGGVTGDWSDYVNTQSYLTSATLLSDNPLSEASLYNPTSSGVSVGLESANKLTYYTPVVSGFQFGVSYTPDNTNLGNGLALNTLSPRQVKNLFNTGLTYSNQFEQVAVNLSATAEVAQGTKTATDTKNHDLRSYEFGASASYAGFTAGGSYGVSGKKFASENTSTLVNKNTQYWTAGAAYAQGPFGVSANYLGTSYQKNKASVFSVSADYQLAPGMLPYVEYAHFSLKPNKYTANQDKNTGNVYLLGTQFRF